MFFGDELDLFLDSLDGLTTDDFEPAERFSSDFHAPGDWDDDADLRLYEEQIELGEVLAGVGR